MAEVTARMAMRIARRAEGRESLKTEHMVLYVDVMKSLMVVADGEAGGCWCRLLVW